MKKPKPRHKAARNLKGALSFVLSLIFVLSFYAAPAAGAPRPGASDRQPSESSGTAEENSAPENVPPIEEEPVRGTGETSSEPPVESEPPAESEPESEPEPEPEFYTVTYNMGAAGMETEQVEPGWYPAKVPVPTLDGATFAGWYNEKGELVEPGYIAVQEDVTFLARFSRNLPELLNTTDHLPYIGGYKNGMFKPGAGISRAEAAQMFYSLLLKKDWSQKSFSDVAGDKWYSTPIGVIANLGIVQGYKDGTFHPNSKITRAEFVTMAINFDTLSEGENIFTDVADSYWAAPYILSACEKGWISGYNDSTFRPGSQITRAEAVTVINKMLGRVPDAGVKAKNDVKNFYDVYPTSWAYSQIAEASTSHTYVQEEGKETWTGYERDNAALSSRWVSDEKDKYYLDGKTRKFVRGPFTINGKKYEFDASSGKAINGFKFVDNYKRYFKDGLMLDDISGLGLVSGPYLIRVYKPSNYLIIFAKDGASGYNTPVKSMITSCGYGTPTGTFYTPARYRWLKMEGDTFAQWCTQIQGNYLFHVVPCWTRDQFDLEVGEYNHLGETRSMGCVRLMSKDAKWIYDNCVLGTKVEILGWATEGPLQKPTAPKLEYWHTWDPTDPTANFRCSMRGCKHTY